MDDETDPLERQMRFIGVRSMSLGIILVCTLILTQSPVMVIFALIITCFIEVMVHLEP